MSKHIVCTVEDLPPGKRKIVELDGLSIGVFNVNGSFHALKNICPHQGAPLCQGSIKGTALPSGPGEYVWAREGEILRCPWHGWEFDLLTGRSIFNPHKVRVKAYDVSVERGRSAAADDPSVETYTVTVEEECVVVHV
jgi:nitrite reductase (NADH) small subunit